MAKSGFIPLQSTSLTVTPIVWRSADGTEYKLHEMSTSHIINIMRQLVNKLAEKLDLNPVPIRTVKARINFSKISWAQCVRYTTFFGNEVQRRLANGEVLEVGYDTIWKDMSELGIKISNTVNSNPHLIINLIKNEDPVWDNSYKRSYLNERSSYGSRRGSKFSGSYDYDPDYYDDVDPDYGRY